MCTAAKKFNRDIVMNTTQRFPFWISSFFLVLTLCGCVKEKTFTWQVIGSGSDKILGSITTAAAETYALQEDRSNLPTKYYLAKYNAQGEQLARFAINLPTTEKSKLNDIAVIHDKVHAVIQQNESEPNSVWIVIDINTAEVSYEILPYWLANAKIDSDQLVGNRIFTQPPASQLVEYSDGKTTILAESDILTTGATLEGKIGENWLVRHRATDI